MITRDKFSHGLRDYFEKRVWEEQTIHPYRAVDEERSQNDQSQQSRTGGSNDLS